METEAIALMADQSPDALILLTTQGQVLHWSRGACAIFGFDAEAARGRSLAELIVPPDRADEQTQRLRETLDSGSGTYESVRRRHDGSLLYVDVSTRLVHAADGAALIVSAEKDVTHIKVLRDAKLMEARFRDLLESTPDGIVMANPTGHIVIANSQAERLFGYEAGELRGCSVDALLPERYRKTHVGHRSSYFVQPRKRAMGSGLDLAGLRKDGSEFPIEISLSPQRTEESAFVMSAIRDISERKRFEKALQEKNQELANANQAKDRFLAGMSHELRTPLNFEAVDCIAVLHDVAAALRPQAHDKGLEFIVHLPELPIVRGTDRRALSQIIFNLAGNAIKFTESGGVSLALRAEAVDGARQVEVQVEDSGINIPLADQDKLFGAFTRVNSARPNAPEGTGLGLHLSQKLAELLGGKIVFRSESGKGSRFTLVLPGA